MTKAIRLYENGGPEVFKYEDVEVGDPGPGQIKIKQTAIGLNFIDVYQRTGLYPAESFPDIVGMEAAGVVEAVGEGVTDKKVGDRVAYCMIKGAYTEARCVEAWKAVKLPDAVDDKTAAAMMLKGLTAHYLLHRTYPHRGCYWPMSCYQLSIGRALRARGTDCLTALQGWLGRRPGCQC